MFDVKFSMYAKNLYESFWGMVALIVVFNYFFIIINLQLNIIDAYPFLETILGFIQKGYLLMLLGPYDLKIHFY
jgi:hypothetical protein